MFGWGDAVKGVTDLVGQFVEDKDKANELETKIKNKLLSLEQEVITAQRDVIVAEAKSQSFIARNWRPIMMLTFVGIIANNYILFPYITGNPAGYVGAFKNRCRRVCNGAIR